MRIMRILTIFVKDLFGFPGEPLESLLADSKQAITRSILLDSMFLETVGIDSINQRSPDSEGSTPTHPRIEAGTGRKQPRKLGKSSAQVNADEPREEYGLRPATSYGDQSMARTDEWQPETRIRSPTEISVARGRAAASPCSRSIGSMHRVHYEPSEGGRILGPEPRDAPPARGPRRNHIPGRGTLPSSAGSSRALPAP